MNKFIKPGWYYILQDIIQYKEIRDFYVQGYLIILEQFIWLIFGYLLLLFTTRKSFKLVMYREGLYAVGELLEGEGRKKMIKLFNRKYVIL